MSAYHDEEWGAVVHEDERLFELLTLEGAQAGLSWETVLKKRDNYRKVFRGFVPADVAKMGDRDVERLMKNEGVVRHRQKLLSTISNARSFLEVQRQEGSFDTYLWRFTDGRPIVNRRTLRGPMPATTPLSDTLSRDLKRRGFSFVGSTIVYAFMQAVGMVNDHAIECFRYRELAPTPGLRPRKPRA